MSGQADTVRPAPIPHGGWTPSDDWDLCAGGHPGGHRDNDGTPTCNRCGRVLDLTRCPHGRNRSYCQDCSIFDKGVVRYRNEHPDGPLPYVLRRMAARIGVELAPHERCLDDDAAATRPERASR